MAFWLWAVFMLLLLIVGTQLVVSLRLTLLRRSGQYPQPGKAVLADVERLLKSNKYVWAVRCYREVHACSLREATEAVKRLQLSDGAEA